jgi:hypothetical protein
MKPQLSDDKDQAEASASYHRDMLMKAKELLEEVITNEL